MTAMTGPGLHPVSRAVSTMRDCAGEVTETPLWSMSPAEAGDTLRELARLKAQVAELELRVAAHAESLEVGQDVGATSTGAWWAHETRQTRNAAFKTLHLAHAVGTRFDRVRAGLAAGEVSVEQAQVIVAALEKLPPDLEADIVARAEEVLVGYASEHDPITLTKLGRSILDVVAPEVGEAHEAKLLEREEREVAAATRLTITDDGHGRCHLRGTIPTLHGAMLRKALLALAAPKHQTATHGTLPPRRPGPERLGRAFCDYIESYPADQLPKAGGLAATVVVTMTHQALTGALKAACLDTGEAISPGLARRLACEAGIIPIVLGGESEVLDLGRKDRFHTPKQRIAIGARDKTCTAEGCDWPPGLCHVHHDTPWSSGGSTSVEDGRLLCPRHHARAHDPTYEMTKLPGGKVAFHRRT